MKKFLMCLIVGAFTVPCSGAVQVKMVGGTDDGLDYLRNEIRKLENDLANKTEKLNKCAEKNKNFQIAGIATVGLAGAGVATNISLYSKMKDQKKQAENMNNKIATANTKMNEFEKEMEKWAQNLDPEKFYEECQKENITDADFQRIKQKIDQDDFENITESDKIIMEKILRAARKSQKEQKE